MHRPVSPVPVAALRLVPRTRKARPTDALPWFTEYAPRVSTAGSLPAKTHLVAFNSTVPLPCEPPEKPQPDSPGAQAKFRATYGTYDTARKRAVACAKQKSDERLSMASSKGPGQMSPSVIKLRQSLKTPDGSPDVFERAKQQRQEEATSAELRRGGTPTAGRSVLTAESYCRMLEAREIPAMTDDQWLAIKANGDQLFKQRRDEVREGRESLAQALQAATTRLLRARDNSDESFADVERALNALKAFDDITEHAR